MLYFFDSFRSSVISTYAFFFLILTILIAPYSFADKSTTIIIDPGHGGSDIGTRGADNSLEKTISLNAAKILQQFLLNDFNIKLTRSDDYFVSIGKRVETANRLNANLFISIHTGAGFTREANRSTIIYYKKPKMPTNKSLANEAIGSDEWERVQLNHIQKSRILSENINRRLASSLSFNKPRTDRLSLKLLSSVNMPAVLIEIGHLTNPSEEQRLNNTDFLSDYMREIALEIKAFLGKK